MSIVEVDQINGILVSADNIRQNIQVHGEQWLQVCRVTVVFGVLYLEGSCWCPSVVHRSVNDIKSRLVPDSDQEFTPA